MATARNTLQTIIARNYIATALQIETLAHERYTSNVVVLQSDETYLRVLLAGSQAKLGRGRRAKPNAQDQLQVLEGVNKPFYEAVLRGVTTPDIEPDESVDDDERARRTRARNSRSGFARSSKSTLKTFVEAGGDLRALDVMTVTKGQIRDAFAPPKPTDRVARQLQTSGEAFMRALLRQARASPDAAQASAEAFMAALQQTLEQIEGEPEEEPPAPPQRPAEAPAQRTRVGIPTFRVPGSPVLSAPA